MSGFLISKDFCMVCVCLSQYNHIHQTMFVKKNKKKKKKKNKKKKKKKKNKQKKKKKKQKKTKKTVK